MTKDMHYTQAVNDHFDVKDIKESEKGKTVKNNVNMFDSMIKKAKRW